MEYGQGRKIYFLLILLVIIIFCGCVFSVVVSDRQAPSLSYDDSKMVKEYSDDMQLVELLAGVTAYDEEDGDVSDTLSVVNIIVLSDGENAEVTFAAKDKSNNIVKDTVRIKYTGDKHFVDSSVVDKENMTGGDSELKDEEETTDPTTTEIETPEVQTPDTKEDETLGGGVATLPEGGSGEPQKINREQVEATGIPQIELKYTDYVMHIGDEFTDYTALDWVSATYDNGDQNVANRIQIDGRKDVDTSVIGSYNLIYRVSDKDGNVSENRILTVHVIE